MIRRWLLPPDVEVQTPDGPLAVVSPQALAEELAQAASILYRSGGVLMVGQERATGLIDGEMLPTSVAFEWRDRTDAKPAPETPAAVRGRVDFPEVLVAPEPETAQPDEFLAENFLEQPRSEAMGSLDEEEEADESSIPVALRG